MDDDYGVVRSINFPATMLKEIEWMCDKHNPDRKYKNRTNAVVSLLHIGLYVIENKGKIESGEMIQEMSKIIKTEQTMDWLQSLSSSQLSGLTELIHMVKENPQRKLI